MTDRELAERIAEAVWVNGVGDQAGHLRLFTDPGKEGRYLSGWGHKPFVDRVEQAIREAREGEKCPHARTTWVDDENGRDALVCRDCDEEL